MKEKFKDVRIKGKAQLYLDKINIIIKAYQDKGYKLTLRQLYYQLVSNDLISNQTTEYANLSDILTRARMGGFVDWDAIEDRVRIPRKSSEWEDLGGLVDSACSSYRLPRWQDQDYYIELWTEKDAIAGILLPITKKYHITLIVNRGYSSVTAMYDASKRFIAHEDKKCLLLYLGDHDPSGLDMDRDITHRLEEFGADIRYQRIGLTWDQIQSYRPPPNPAKVSDPRADKYIEQFGEQSWEVDALPPEVLHKLVETMIQRNMDLNKYNDWIAKENFDKERLKQAVEKLLEE